VNPSSLELLFVGILFIIASIPLLVIAYLSDKYTLGSILIG
jgi:hypothetical protein